MTSQWDTWRFGSGVASWGGSSGEVQSAWNRGWQCQWCKALCKAKAKCCHQCGTEMGSARAWSALEGCGSQVARSPWDHGGPQMSTGDVSSEAGTSTCGTDGSLSTKEKKEAADELASLEAALSALGATRGTTQIAPELREQIANKKKTLTATKPIGARVDGCRAWPQG